MHMNVLYASVSSLHSLWQNILCIINMHLHCHLRDILLDYGPVQSFSFERYNGILGDLPTNHRATYYSPTNEEIHSVLKHSKHA